ncbi:uncharacterized protein LOC110082782 isoform X3 [Pogona vitticeps]
MIVEAPAHVQKAASSHAALLPEAASPQSPGTKSPGCAPLLLADHVGGPLLLQALLGSPLPPGAAGAEEQEVPNRPASGHGGLLSRLSRLEAEVQYLSQELRAEKLLWSSRYLELLREQQGLLAQLQGQDQTLWLQDLEGQTDAWGPPDGPRGPSDPGSTARGVGTQTGEEGAAGPRRHRDVPGQQGAWSRLPPT